MLVEQVYNPSTVSRRVFWGCGLGVVLGVSREAQGEGSPSVAASGASAAPGNLLGMQLLRPRFRPTESEALGLGPVNLVF